MRAEICRSEPYIFPLKEKVDSKLKATNKRSQKTFHVSSGNDHPYPIFCDHYPLDTKNPSSYTPIITPTVKKQRLIIIIGNGDHVDTMYAGALFTLGEFAGGILHIGPFDCMKFFPIVKELNICFRRPALTDVVMEVNI